MEVSEIFVYGGYDSVFDFLGNNCSIADWNIRGVDINGSIK